MCARLTGLQRIVPKLILYFSVLYACMTESWITIIRYIFHYLIVIFLRICFKNCGMWGCFNVVPFKTKKNFFGDRKVSLVGLANLISPVS